jgi:hypothetical protein
MNLTRAALFALLPLAALVTQPVAAQDRERREPRERPMPGRQRADPGKVAATDFAFARAARDEGQWTAFREYAASGAQMHLEGGPVDASEFLARRADPPEPVRWTPNEVWSSCDGSIAVSYGRSVQPDGIVGSYVTVWQRQRNGDYRWVYDTGTPDNPQPVIPIEVRPDGDTIVVRELTAIRALTADCRAPAEAAAAPVSVPAGAQTGGGEARDATLRWRWEHLAHGQWRVVVDWVREGAWTEALSFDVPERQG